MKKIIATFVIATPLLLSAMPAIAADDTPSSPLTPDEDTPSVDIGSIDIGEGFSSFVGGLLGNLLPGFDETIGQFKSIFEGDSIVSVLEDELDFLPELSSVLENTGNGDFPDPSKIEEALENIDLSELFAFFDESAIETDTVEARNRAATEISSEIAAALAHSTTFSDEAQEAMSERVDGSIEAAQMSQSLAEDSAGQDVTQNIERNQSEQLAILTGQISGLLIESQQDRTDRAMNTVMTSETLQQIQTMNTRAENQQRSAAAHALQGSAGVQIFGEYQPTVIQ